MLKKTALEYSVLTVLPTNCSDFTDSCKEVKMSCESSSGHSLTSPVLLPHWRWCWAPRAHTQPRIAHPMLCKALETKVWLLLSDSTLAICSDRGHISFLLAVRQLPSHSTDSLYLKRDTIASTDQQKVFRWRTSSLESSHWQHFLHLEAITKSKVCLFHF